MNEPNVQIIGGGLIGGSISLALTKLGIAHQVADTNVNVQRILESKGDVQTSIDPDLIDLVFIAVPPDMVEQEMMTIFDRFPNAIVSDVASVKQPYHQVVAASGILERYVGGHPMAGREIGGAESADANLFADRIWILCTTEQNHLALSAVEELVSKIGAIPIQMKSDEHDEVVGVLSHLPQILSSTLVNVAVSNSGNLDVAGPAFRDMTRIASSDPFLWTQILMANEANVTKFLDKTIESLTRLRGVLSTKQQDAIFEYLNQSRQKALSLPGKHGGRANRYGEISIRVKDEPGSLAQLFVLAQKINLNIEDVYIEHVLNRPLAVIKLFINPNEIERARLLYAAEGWELRD